MDFQGNGELDGDLISCEPSSWEVPRDALARLPEQNFKVVVAPTVASSGPQGRRCERRRLSRGPAALEGRGSADPRTLPGTALFAKISNICLFL